jgi:SOS-response transcriptional repressor LexA
MVTKSTLQESIYTFLREYQAREGVVPSYREIAAACHCSLGSVERHLALLESRGLVERRARTKRGYMVVDSSARNSGD